MKLLFTRYALFSISIVVLFILLGFIFTTNPASLSLSLLVVPPLLVFVGLLCLIVGVSRAFNKPFSSRHHYVVAIFCSLAPVLYILLRSLGLASARELLLIALLGMVFIAYVLKRHMA